MPKPSTTTAHLADGFSTRLHMALQRKGKRASATVLEREFNLRWRGAPITVNATRKWLLGLAVPTLDKLRVLALWLDVSEEWLRWGVDNESVIDIAIAPTNNVVADILKAGLHKGAETIAGRTPEETSLIQDYRILESRDKQVLRAIVEVMLRARKL